MIITFWKWTTDSSIFLVSASTNDIFDNSLSFKRQWYLDFDIEVLSPLTRPIPRDYKMYVAVKNESFPYNTSAIKVVENIFTPAEGGTYFIASSNDIGAINAELV